MHSDRLILTRSAEGHGRIHVEGRAYYTNAAHNVNSGKVSGDAIAMGPFLHIFDHGAEPNCVLDLKYDITSKPSVLSTISCVAVSTSPLMESGIA